MTTPKLFAAFKANIAKLPIACFTDTQLPGHVLRFDRGKHGYTPLKSEHTAAEFNYSMGVTPAQVSAMVYGSRYGFHAPGADVDNYKEDGSAL